MVFDYRSFKKFQSFGVMCNSILMDSFEDEIKSDESFYLDAENENFEISFCRLNLHSVIEIDDSGSLLEADMGNTASDQSNISDEQAINVAQGESDAQNVSEINVIAEVLVTAVADVNKSNEDQEAPKTLDSVVNKEEKDPPKEQDMSPFTTIAKMTASVNDKDTTDIKTDLTTNSIIGESKQEVEAQEQLETVALVGTESQKFASGNEKAVPATPPATPTTNGESPQFPSPNLDTTFVLSLDGDHVSNPTPVPHTICKEILKKPPTPTSDAIITPILEAAAIANAVAGISISNPATPLSISLPSSEEPVFVTKAPQEATPQVNASPTASAEGVESSFKNVRDEEVEALRARIQMLETELVAALSKPGTKNHVLVETIKQQHEELLSKARGMLFDKTKIVKNQELQIEALSAQVASLKEVNSITKDLIEIRNSEIKHLEERLTSMEERFKLEKERHLLVMKRAETGQSINNDLKTEYEGQLKIFKELREMYDKRVQALVTENQRLKDCLAAAKGLPSPSVN